MLNAEILDNGDIVVAERPAPNAGADLVVVQILVSPMCTEFKDRQGHRASDHLGHEAAGVVVDPGNSTRVAAGDRVVVMPQFACGVCWLCQRGDHIYCPNQRDVLAETGSEFGVGTMAQYVLKPDWLLLPVPDDIDLVHAAMACCGFGPTFNAHTSFGTNSMNSVVVSGCGPVGLGGIVQAGVRGARIFAYETAPYRAALASALGAESVFDPREEDAPHRVIGLTDDRGAEFGIETSGAPTAARVLGRSLRIKGRLAIVAGMPAELTIAQVMPTGVSVFGCWHWNHQSFASDMWTSVRKAGDAIDTMITHQFRLEDVSAAMDVQDTGECGKVLLFPFGAEAARSN